MNMEEERIETEKDSVEKISKGEREGKAKK